MGSLLNTTQLNPIVLPEVGVSSYNPIVIYMPHTICCFQRYFSISSGIGGNIDFLFPSNMKNDENQEGFAKE